MRRTFQSKILGSDAAPQRMLTLNLARKLARGPKILDIDVQEISQGHCQRLGR
jgi:hypothetical protein